MSIMQMKNFGKDNGATFNAKGDLSSVPNLTATSYDATGITSASITFNSDGTYTVIGNDVPTSSNGNWVTTGVGWQGGANYTLSWTRTSSVGNGTYNPNLASSSVTLGSNFSFDGSVNIGENISASWNVTITNDATGTQTPESVSFTVTVDADSDGNPGS